MDRLGCAFRAASKFAASARAGLGKAGATLRLTSDRAANFAPAKTTKRYLELLAEFKAADPAPSRAEVGTRLIGSLTGHAVQFQLSPPLVERILIPTLTRAIAGQLDFNVDDSGGRMRDVVSLKRDSLNEVFDEANDRLAHNPAFMGGKLKVCGLAYPGHIEFFRQQGIALKVARVKEEKSKLVELETLQREGDKTPELAAKIRSLRLSLALNARRAKYHAGQKIHPDRPGMVVKPNQVEVKLFITATVPVNLATGEIYLFREPLNDSVREHGQLLTECWYARAPSSGSLSGPPVSSSPSSCAATRPQV